MLKCSEKYCFKQKLYDCSKGSVNVVSIENDFSDEDTICANYFNGLKKRFVGVDCNKVIVVDDIRNMTNR